MNKTHLLREIIIKTDFYNDHNELFEYLVHQVKWESSLRARKTASFGIPYNYSNMAYEYCEFPKEILIAKELVDIEVGYTSNNCLVNYYDTPESSMGFHSDNIELLENGTGIAILSLGSMRVMRFSNKINPEITIDFTLNKGSFFYMSKEIQAFWKHAILKEQNAQERISLTFRKIKE
jgi:alkylated DNA repair dioxygenase AlkB